jgi:hypothetical protein
MPSLSVGARHHEPAAGEVSLVCQEASTLRERYRLISTVSAAYSYNGVVVKRI